MTQFRFEELSAADTDALVALSRAVDWRFSAADFASQLAAGRLFGVRGQSGEPALIAAGGAFDFGSYAAIGAIMILPDWQRRGIGRALMEMLHQTLPEGRPVSLIATEAGEPLYAALGYQATGRIEKMSAPLDGLDWYAGAPAAPADRILPARPDDNATLEALDAAATGARRAALVLARRAQAHSAFLALDSGGAPSGYALGVPQGPLTVIGPVIARNDEDALALIESVARSAARQPGCTALRIDLAPAQTTLADALRARGFATDETPVIMTRGAAPDTQPGYGPFVRAVPAQTYG
ncbi:hypothetical protein CEG14_16495 [Bordetella genomosp. 1]|uniref:N-acetyltransferase domain-containing protein n=1 Tax=Bordetella genomosp. 1 TaxID=1395607 RepID=A0A261SGQ0_9BORD|nr:GNAT family N-acetyltransferase [Bordetella genomosp. 1]MDQ8031381.1 GNAT family N-acetyltransferase [Bordetella sp.]OZI36574.1 hypothetical protein CEG14_16495 [Bordetella genomosp. 1]OZI58033.1 hypothetical protein CAL27_21885 [Bordetella genomosp. 1]